MPEIVILGCGYTGTRVAERFLGRGSGVVATTREPSALKELAARGVNVVRVDVAERDPIEVPRGALLLYSIPVTDRPVRDVLARLTEIPRRVVYLSTTGVYGSIRDVDEHTVPTPDSEQGRLRLQAEREVQAGPWSSLVLRPAAIYGPDRGVHVAMREGRFRLAGDGGNFVSRIHVEDLAAHVEAGLLSEVTGAYPVADEMPCTSREIAEYYAHRLHLPMPPAVQRETLHETRRSDRRVDGRAIRALLKITLHYPSYRASGVV